jgi:hypothetical protein
LNLYEIEFSIKEKVEIPEDMREEYGIPEDVDINELHQHVSRTMHLGGENFFDVQEEAISMIEEVFFEDVPEEEIFYEIIGIKQVENIFIANWPNVEDPFDKAKHMADEDVMLVKCPECEEVVRIAEDGWDWLVCKKYGFKIMKDQLLKLGKHWVVVKLGKDIKK